jgi:hypothetical protein
VSRIECVQRDQVKKRSILQAIKVERGCADCGYNANPVALEFDHRPGEVKSLSIGRAVSQAGIQRLLAEVEKCDVVCANCHRIRSFNRGQHVVLRKAAA